jgi:subtilisin family serine protease
MHKQLARPILIALMIVSITAQSADSGEIIRKSVMEVVSTRSGSSFIEVLVSFDDDLDLGALKMARLKHKLNRVDNYRDVMNRLDRNRMDLENSILPRLKSMKKAGSIDSYKFFTSSRTVMVRTRTDNVGNLAKLPGARLVNLNHAVALIDPVDEKDSPAFSATAQSNSALEAINIGSLWERGLTGNGSLICSFDTGIDGDHPALGSKWRGNNGGTAGESWFAPRGSSLPYDNIGHGSHVMGIMLGSTVNDTIGVAPNAQWISAAVIDQGASFSTTIADILSAFDWALNPDGDINTIDDLPHVICNSWGVPKGIFSDCDNTFWTAIDNVEAAGIVTIFAAGNEGPLAGTMRNPADRASSPLNTLSVGAVDPQSLIVADFSSRGPGGCGGSAVKPELVAPGVGIYSSYKDGGYRLMSGTSMASPFVAGMVALMRQYNPEATVEEIKNALIQSTIDKGPVGEDNDYGYGLIDASQLLDFLPTPELPNLTVHNHQFYSGGDSFADPGETAEVILTINEPAGLLDSVNVWLTSNSESISTGDDTLCFRFAQGTTYAVGVEPFFLQVSSAAISGSRAELVVHFSFVNGMGHDSVLHLVDIGHMLPGSVLAVNSGDLTMSASDFGQFGFGEGSIYQAGGTGLRFNGGANLLFEAGLIIGRSEQMVSDAIRGAGGEFKVSDFVPMKGDFTMAANTENDLVVAYADDESTLPIPVEIRQTVHQSVLDFAIVQFEVRNPTPEKLDHLAIGFFCDLDIDRALDRIGFDSMMGMMYHYNPDLEIYIGFLGVSANEFSYLAAQNPGDGKQGFTTAEKFNMVDSYGLNIETGDAGDWYLTVSRTADQIEGFSSRKMAVIVAAGASLPELRAAAEAGMNAYDYYLDVDDEWAVLPTSMELRQNYPNPFNPQTTISFSLASAQDAALIVYNVTGQRVRTLVEGTVQAGEHSVVWDGRDEYGNSVASGIYFYRLTTEEETQSRKMVFLK